MKKILLICLLVFGLCGGAFAADYGTMLNQEINQANTFFSGVNSNNYAASKTVMSPKMQQELTAAKFTQLQATLKKDFGTMKDFKFIALEKFDQTDRLTYLAAFDTNKLARINITFTANDKNGVNGIMITPIQPKKGK